MNSEKNDSIKVVIGKVVRIIYTNLKNPLNLFSICEVEINSLNFQFDEKKIIIKILAEPPIKGQVYKFFGEISEDKEGVSFQTSAYIRDIPIENSGLVDFFGSGLFEGIRRKKAQKIVDSLGDDCLIKIINNPEVLLSVKGISEKILENIQETIIDNIKMQELILKLHDFKISLSLAKKIYSHFGHASVAKILENPYCLSNTVKGISFQKADNIASTLKISGDDSRRIKGAIEHVLDKIYNEDGSTYDLSESVLNKTNQLLFELDGIYYPIKLLQKNLDELTNTNIEEIEGFVTDLGQVRRVNQRVYLERYFQYEQNIATTLLNLAKAKFLYSQDEKEKIIDIYVREKLNFDIRLSDTQELAILRAIFNRISVLTGGPGTGKSTIIKYLLIIYSRIQMIKGILEPDEILNKVVLLAPTGRAAKRIYEVTEIQAQTIHSFLEKSEDTFTEERLFIIDEASMLDLSTMNRLVKRLRIDDQLIIVGDKDQLPPISAGNIFKDIIESGVFPVLELDQVYRQEGNVELLDLATNIRRNEMTNENMTSGQTVKWLSASRDEIVITIQNTIINMLNSGIKFEDIQIISPIHRSEQGIHHINQFIQSALCNKIIPIDQELTPSFYSNSEYEFFIGDRVIQLKNNFDKNVVNGEIGIITGVTKVSEETEKMEGLDRTEEIEKLIVQFDTHEALYTPEEAVELALAYCFSVHKSQGSEFPHVILPLSMSYFYIINRNLLYTAVTRAKKSLNLIGEHQIFLAGVHKKPLKRYTFLKELLLKVNLKVLNQ